MQPTSRRVRTSPRSHLAHPPTSPNRGPVYRPRRPTQTPLFPLVQHHLETFLAQAAEADPMATASPGGSSVISGPISVVAFWRTASLEPAAPAMATTSRSPSVARDAACVRRVTRAAWSCTAAGRHQMHGVTPALALSRPQKGLLVFLLWGQRSLTQNA